MLARYAFALDQRGMDMAQDDDEGDLDRLFFTGSGMYDPAPRVTAGPEMTAEELERWAEKADRFLNGCPNRAARVVPKYPASGAPAKPWFGGVNSIY